MTRTVLVTGGAGFIGAHTTVVLLQAGYQVVVLDNLCNSTAGVFDSIARITGQSPLFIQGDIRDARQLQALFQAHDIDAVVHLAGLKAVGESVQQPLLYYDNNVLGSLQLIRAAQAHGVNQFVFSSSATVYGDPQYLPIDERHPAEQQSSPYGRNKRMVELMLQDVQGANPAMRVAVLRYFNPIGAHESGLIGENPKGIPNNLLPYVTRVAAGKLKELSVYGDDYPTPDGTGVRDYIHVMDLSEAHLKALQAIGSKEPGFHIWNLGTGQGHSVLEIIGQFERITGQAVPHKVVQRRSGDIAACYAGTELAQADLGWQARRGLQDMLRDAWRWENNPAGLAR